MKDVLSVVTFVMGALDFAMFLVAVKPDALSAVPSPGKRAHCKLGFLVSQYAVANPNGGSAESIVPDRSSLNPSMTMSTNEVNYECDVGRDCA